MEKDICKKKKGALYIAMSILMAFSLFLVPLNVEAATVIEVPYSEPSYSDNQGYMTVLTYDESNVKYYLYTFFWSITPRTDNEMSSLSSSRMSITVNENSIDFICQVGMGQQGTATCIRINNAYTASIFYSGSFVSTESFSSTFPYKIVGYQIFGNLGSLNTNISNVINYSVLYGSEKLMYDKVTDLYNLLQELYYVAGRNENLLHTYLPKLNQIDFMLQNHVLPEMDTLLDYTEEVILELEYINEELDSVDDRLATANTRLKNIYDELSAFHDDMVNQTAADKNKTDKFSSDSDNQSSKLNDLNEQTQPDKIDVDNASGVVDQNLNIGTDANYGVLLSTFTSNGKILTMLLAVSSIGLISYVLFGKR